MYRHGHQFPFDKKGMMACGPEVMGVREMHGRPWTSTHFVCLGKREGRPGPHTSEGCLWEVHGRPWPAVSFWRRRGSLFCVSGRCLGNTWAALGLWISTWTSVRAAHARSGSAHASLIYQHSMVDVCTHFCDTHNYRSSLRHRRAAGITG